MKQKGLYVEPTDAARDTWRQHTRVVLAHRILPERLKAYADLTSASIDWIGLVERCSRFDTMALMVEERAAVGLVAHLLGVTEALLVAPAESFGELVEMVDRGTRREVSAAVQVILIGMEL